MNSWISRIANSPQVRSVRQATENLPPGVRAVAKAGATGAAVGVAVFAVPPLLGFTTAGVAAGSVAAAIQSAVYGAAVPAGGLFAIMQSIGATATIVPAVIAGAAAAAGAAAGEEEGDNEGEDLHGNEGVQGGGPNGDGGRDPGDDGPDKRSQNPGDTSGREGHRAAVGIEEELKFDSSEVLFSYDEESAETPIQVLAVDDPVNSSNSTQNHGSGEDWELLRSRNNTY